jgi:UDP-N-acetylglucosamine--N-acetylmuramyl-(pentapeptide) pyrophosphoryl-undecaprenol N-acetylglucosamine transferase
LINNNELQQKLSNNIKELALPNATKEIVTEIEKLIIS